MKLFAIGDLHMPGDAGKTMDVFGEHWRDHLPRVAADWDARVSASDLVLVPGDHSWAMRVEGARDDLAWLGERPGTKLMIRGNHDYWWRSLSKVQGALPPSCHAIQGDAWVDETGSITVGGTRLWDVPGLSMGNVFATAPTPRAVTPEPRDPERDARIYRRELGRLEASLRAMAPGARLRIVMLHYPPVSPALEETDVTRLLSEHRVDLCVFGHLHGLVEGTRIGGTLAGVRYVLASADYVGFRPLEISLPLA